MPSPNAAPPHLDSDAETVRGLNLLQVFVLFALILGVVLFGLRRLDGLRDPLAEVDRLYLGGASSKAPPAANASSRSPRLSEAARQRLLASAAPRRLSGDVLLEDDHLSGLFLVDDGAQIVLRNVTIEGSLVSAAGLDGRDPGSATVVIQGAVSLLPGDGLPGLCVWLPGGSLLASDATTDVLIDGDVVAKRIELLGHGDVIGKLYGGDATRLSTDVRVSPRAFADIPLPAPAEPDLSELLEFEFPR